MGVFYFLINTSKIVLFKAIYSFLIKEIKSMKIIVDALAVSLMSASVFTVNVGKDITTFTDFLKYVLFRFLYIKEFQYGF